MRTCGLLQVSLTLLAAALLAGCSAQASDPACIPAFPFPVGVTVEPSAQVASSGSLRLDHVLQELQGDLTAHVFNAPALRVTLTPDGEAQAHARFIQDDVEATQALLDTLDDEELYMVLAHEAGHLTLHGNRTGCESAQELQSQELEADAFAVDLAVSAHKEAEVLARALRKVVTDEGPSRAQTHPSLLTRLQAITARTKH
jgi:Zn-dependent protease with chaperone function